MTEMGGDRENYSIGAAWRSRAAKLHATVILLTEDIRKEETLKVELTMNGAAID